MSDIRRFEHLWTKGQKCLSVGCGMWRQSGDWTTLDLDERTNADWVGDVSNMVMFDDESFDFVLASHVLEHIHDPFPAVDEVWRVLRPGGRFLVVVPHALSFGYLAPPQHTRPFFPDTFFYFSPEVYEKEGTHGTGAYEGRHVHPWEFETLEVTPEPGWSWLRSIKPVFNFAANHLFGVLQDIYVVMRKPE